MAGLVGCALQARCAAQSTWLCGSGVETSADGHLKSGDQLTRAVCSSPLPGVGRPGRSNTGALTNLAALR